MWWYYRSTSWGNGESVVVVHISAILSIRASLKFRVLTHISPLSDSVSYRKPVKALRLCNESTNGNLFLLVSVPRKILIWKSWKMSFSCIESLQRISLCDHMDEPLCISLLGFVSIIDIRRERNKLNHFMSACLYVCVCSQANNTWDKKFSSVHICVFVWAALYTWFFCYTVAKD